MPGVAAVVGRSVPPRVTDRAMLREQLAAAWLRLRGESLLVLGLIAVATAILLESHRRTGSSADFVLPDMSIPPSIVGLFAPLALWRSEGPSRREYFLALPVDRTRHTLARVLAGWLWVMLVIALYLAWALGISVALDGDVGIGFTRTRVLQPALLAGGTVRDLGMVGHGWLWLVPFTAATIGYLVVSVVALAADHPWRWFGGSLFAFALLGMLAEGAGLGAPAALYDTLLGRYGLEAIVTGLSTQRVDPSLVPPTAEGALALPDLHAWRTSTMLCLIVGATGVVLVARKHRE